MALKQAFFLVAAIWPMWDCFPLLQSKKILFFLIQGCTLPLTMEFVLSRAQAFPFKHNDLEHLENASKIVCLKEIDLSVLNPFTLRMGLKLLYQKSADLQRNMIAHLIVDEAHAVGVCGPMEGVLSPNKQASSLNVFAQITTFGKALGTYGAIVLGSSSLKQALINFATSYIYTTALPFHSLAAIKCSYDLFPHWNLKEIIFIS